MPVGRVYPIDRGSRTAERQGRFREQEIVVVAWRWAARLDRYTCVFCWAMHGTVHPLSELLYSHATCHCVRDAVLWDEPPSAAGPSGPEIFARLPWTMQLALLGPRVYFLYASGRIQLRDVIGYRQQEGGGWVGYVRSAAQIERQPKPHLPPRRALMVDPRHRLVSVTQNSFVKDENTVYEPAVDVLADVAGINRGEAIRRGEFFLLPSGRLYGQEGSGRLYPIDGPGLHRLGRGAYRALGVYNEFGLSGQAEGLLDRRGIVQEEREAARRAWRAGQEGRP